MYSKLDFFVLLSFIFHFVVLYYKSYRVLNFLVKAEFVFLSLFIIFCIKFNSYEYAFLLVYLTILACEVSVGLSLLIGFVRLKDKKNVKSSIFTGV